MTCSCHPAVALYGEGDGVLRGCCTSTVSARVLGGRLVIGPRDISLPAYMTPQDKVLSLHGPQEVIDSAIGNLPPVGNSLINRFAKMVPDIDARHAVFVCGLSETGKRAADLLCATALVSGAW